MKRRPPIALLLLATACGEPGGGSPSADAGAPDAESIAPPAPPAPPALTPCPQGWREVVPAEGDRAECDPWPASGRATCPAGEAHFPGEPGCAPIGAPCPAGDWPEGLPAGVTVLHVRAGTPAGGDGSAAAPYGTIAQAMSIASPGTIVALAKGTYEEAVALRAGVTLWGACAAQTRISHPVPTDLSGIVTVVGANTVLRDVRVGGARAGVLVTTGRSVRLEGVLVEEATGAGLLALGGVVTGDTVVVRGTRSRGDRTFGHGLHAEVGATFTLTRVVIEGSRAAGASVVDAGTSLTLADAAILDTESEERAALGGYGLHCRDGARIDAARLYVARSRAAGAFVSYPGSRLTAVDAVIRETRPTEADGTGGLGLVVQYGATAELARVVLAENHMFGAAANEMSTSLTITDGVVRDTIAQASDARYGRGVGAQYGSRVELRRVALLRNMDVGIIALSGGTTVLLEDLVVRDTRSRADLNGGRGVELAHGATGELRRAELARNREISLAVFGEIGATRLVATDLVIRDALHEACAETTCAEEPLGIGIGAYVDGAIDLTRFVVRTSPFCGVQLARGGVVDLHEGEISNHPFGVNVTTAGFDLTRLQDRVIYRDNVVNLDASTQPLPDPSTP